MDRWKAQDIHFLDMHVQARSLDNCLERSDRPGLEVGQKNDKNVSFQTWVARSTGGSTWRQRGVLPISLDH